MSRPNFDRLAPPPRDVPIGLRIGALFASPLALAGWILLAFSSPFFWAFALNADVLSAVLFRGDVDRVTGRVTATRGTGATEGKVQIHEVEYAYSRPDGGLLHGTAYLRGSPPGVGEPVTVEFLPLRPETSRVQGMRSATFGPGAGVVAIFPAIGAAVAALGFRSGLRRLELLRSGQAAAAELVAEESTNLTINDRPVVRLFFEFKAADGRRPRVSQATSSPEALRDEKRETVLFRPDDPERAVLVDSLPKSIAADEQGQLVSAGASGLAVVLPMLTALGNAGCAAHLLLR